MPQSAAVLPFPARRAPVCREEYRESARKSWGSGADSQMVPYVMIELSGTGAGEADRLAVCPYAAVFRGESGETRSVAELFGTVDELWRELARLAVMPTGTRVTEKIAPGVTRGCARLADGRTARLGGVAALQLSSPLFADIVLRQREFKG
jgi:hypothetical protein